MKKSGTLAFSATLVIYSGLLFYSTFFMRTLALTSVGPAVVPRLVTGALCLLSLLLIVIEWRHSCGRPVEEKLKTEIAADPHRQATAKTMALLVLYAAGLGSLGFLSATVMYLFLQILVFKRWSGWLAAIRWALLSLVIAVAVYFIFATVFAMSLPTGWLD